MTLNEGINVNYLKKNLHKNITTTKHHKPQLGGINEGLRIFNNLGTLCKRIDFYYLLLID